MNRLKEFRSFAVCVFVISFLFAASLSSCGNKAEEKGTESTGSTEQPKDTAQSAAKAGEQGEHPKRNDEHPKGGEGQEHPKKGNEEHPKKQSPQ